ncbi:DUF874 family protein, partial [Helicobacter pylori]|uniref:DUF874 family protein n=1 Tax=Helicobacter pylori TaxID=210 RepID=UPI003C6C2877
RLVIKSVKIGKTNKVGKNAETANTKANKETHFKQANAITNTIRSIGSFFTKIAKKVRELVKKTPQEKQGGISSIDPCCMQESKRIRR